MNKRDLKDGMIVRVRGVKDEYHEYYILNSKFYSKEDCEHCRLYAVSKTAFGLPKD